jgi:hypothetical protein
VRLVSLRQGQANCDTGTTEHGECGNKALRAHPRRRERRQHWHPPCLLRPRLRRQPRPLHPRLTRRAYPLASPPRPAPSALTKPGTGSATTRPLSAVFRPPYYRPSRRAPAPRRPHPEAPAAPAATAPTNHRTPSAARPPARHSPAQAQPTAARSRHHAPPGPPAAPRQSAPSTRSPPAPQPAQPAATPHQHQNPGPSQPQPPRSTANTITSRKSRTARQRVAAHTPVEARDPVTRLPNTLDRSHGA